MSFIFPFPFLMPQAVPSVASNTIRTEISTQKYIVPVSGQKDLVARIYGKAQAFPELKNWSIQILPKSNFDNKVRSLDVKYSTATDPHIFSDLNSLITFVNEDSLGKMGEERLLRSLAHEYGHLVQKTKNESKADKWADSYIKSLKKR